MRGPLSADRLFFISSLAFVLGFVLYYAIGYIWPLPPLPEDVLAKLPQDPMTVPFSLPYILNQLNWLLSTAGVVTFVLGLVASRKG